MIYIAAVDIGNATTETAVAALKGRELVFLSSGIASTTGLKGTRKNTAGVLNSLHSALKKTKLRTEDLAMIRINEAAPVIGDFAMETITETIITESTLIGHNPETPGGAGIGTGITVALSELANSPKDRSYIAIIDESWDFEDAAAEAERCMQTGYRLEGAVVGKDDGVLIGNRISRKIPIVDEVRYIGRVPLGMLCAVEVAPAGQAVDILANPYGISTVFGLTPEETKLVVPVARALAGTRSAVVIRTPHGEIRERKIPAGKIKVLFSGRETSVGVDEGSSAVMSVLEKAGPIDDIKGEPGTNAGGMFEKVRRTMAEITEQKTGDIFIKDILAVDTLIPKEVKGSLANEFSLENAVGVAAMVKTKRLLMDTLAGEISRSTGIPVEIGGVEGDMAIRGALTTPGTEKPVAVIDLGAGSTDASYMDRSGAIRSVHLAGAGDMVTMLINSELGLDDLSLAEEIKRNRLAKVESLFHIRHEDGSVEFFEEPLDAALFARVVTVKGKDMTAIPGKLTLERIRSVRQEAKRKVFVYNTLRALKKISPSGNLKEFEYAVLVGGSSLDFEAPSMITDALSVYGVVAGKGNVRATEGPRNAVATGLAIACAEEAGRAVEEADETAEAAEEGSLL